VISGGRTTLSSASMSFRISIFSQKDAHGQGYAGADRPLATRWRTARRSGRTPEKPASRVPCGAAYPSDRFGSWVVHARA